MIFGFLRSADVRCEGPTVSSQTKNLDLRGFDPEQILVCKGWISPYGI